MTKKYNINQTTLKILSLYADDYGKSLHVRKIARETGVDVKAIQLQLARLEKANVLTSILRGRNREYSLSLGNLIAKYFIAMAEAFTSANYLANNFVVKKLIGELGDRLDGIVILFGSFASEKQTRGSDIDLLVVAERELGALSMAAITEAGDLIGREISLKSMTRDGFVHGLESGDPLVMEIVSNHIVLRGIDGFCEMMWLHHAKR